MPKQRQFIVVGSGGFSKEVVWAVQHYNTARPTYAILGYCDDDPAKNGQVIYGYPVLGSPEEVDAQLSEKPCFICSIGDNSARAKVVERVLSLGWIPVTIIDPSVIVADDVAIGIGTYIGVHSILCPNARIGQYAIVNNFASIGHDAVLGDFTQVSPGGRVLGASMMDEGALLGSNAVVLQMKKLGRYATLGACSFALTDIPDYATAIGVPARVTFRHRPGMVLESEGRTMLYRLQAIFRDIFDDPTLRISEELSVTNYPDWDSVAMVHLVLATEAEFCVRFTTNEVANIRSVADLLHLLNNARKIPEPSPTFPVLRERALAETEQGEGDSTPTLGTTERRELRA